MIVSDILRGLLGKTTPTQIPVFQIPSIRHYMDSLAQELIDEIINHIPTEDLPASCLVARRWRHRSQQRYFEYVLFHFRDSGLWEKNIPQHPDGIPACVRHLWLQLILPSPDLEVFDRVLKTFRSMVSLTMFRTGFPHPDRLAGLASLGEFGRGLRRLAFVRVYAHSFADFASLIFSLPNLKELVINRILFTSYKLPAIPPDTWQRGPLESLFVLGAPMSIPEALSRCGLTSHTLWLDPSDEGIEAFVTSSSATIVELRFIGMQPIQAFGQKNPY